MDWSIGMDLSKDGKETNFLMMDTFSKFSVGIVTLNQQANTITKALGDRWFYTQGFLFRIYSDWVKSFENDIIMQLCKLYSIQ